MNERIYQISMKNRFSLIILVFVLSGFFTSGSFAQKEKKSKKEKQNSDQQKPAPNLSLLIDAKKYEITGDTEKAEESYRQFIDRYPQIATAYFELSRILASKRQFDDAIKYSETSVSLDPENIWYQLYLAELQQLTGNYKEAINLYEKISKKEPDNMDYYYQLAALYLNSERYLEAINVYDKIEDKLGITEEISLQKERIFLGLKEYKRAEEELEALVVTYPDDPKYLSILAEFYLANGKPDQALETYKKISVIDPKNPYIHMSMADYYRKTGDKEKAFEELKLGFANPDLGVDAKVNILLSFYSVNQLYTDLKDEAFILAKILVETHPDDAKAHSVYADLLLQDKKITEARDEFLKVVTLDSSRYLIWEEVMQLDLQLEKFDHLRDFGKTVMELFPEQPVPYLLSGIANNQLKNYNEAVKEMNAGVKLVINNDLLLSQFYMYLGDTYHAMNNTEESDKAYEKSLAIDDSNAYVLNNYSYYLSLRNTNLDKAERMAKKAVTIEPDNPSFQDTYGWVLYKLGRFEEAKTWVFKAIQEKETSSGEVLEHYGDILFKLGDINQATEYWIKAKAKGPGSTILDKKIAEKKLYE
jgi:tetratricopeptide (TPR) repeat protein